MHGTFKIKEINIHYRQHSNPCIHSNLNMLKMDILQQEQQRTQVCPDGLAVGVVSLAVDGVGRAVAVGEEAGAEPGDAGEGQQHHGADHPPQLRDRPRQRQHPRPDHRRDDVRARRHQRPCSVCAHMSAVHRRTRSSTHVSHACSCPTVVHASMYRRHNS